jgi:hypothetical protein
MDRWIAAAILLIGLAPVAEAASDPSHYCGEPFAAVQLTKTFGEALTEIEGKCRPGDAILIPIGNGALIGSLCDFTKAVVSEGRDVLCVMVTPRPGR